jgi:hypothetical protein
MKAVNRSLGSLKDKLRSTEQYRLMYSSDLYSALPTHAG